MPAPAWPPPAGWRRWCFVEPLSESLTLGNGGLLLLLALAIPAFRETSDDDWLKKSELAVTFLDRYGNEVGSRGIRHNDAIPLDQFPDHLIKATLAVQRGVIPPNQHFDNPNPHIPFDELGLKVADEPIETVEHDETAVAGDAGFATALATIASAATAAVSARNVRGPSASLTAFGNFSSAARSSAASPMLRSTSPTPSGRA